MRTIALVFFLAMNGTSCMRFSPPELIVARIPITSLDDLITREGVTIDTSSTADGDGSARIRTTGSVTVHVAEVGNISVDDARLIYRARLKTQDLVGRTYLEMWCVFAGQGEYFSRALHAPLSGTNEWTLQETPFFLQKGQNPTSVRLNLVVEGVGTVWLDDVTLSKAPL